MASRQHCSVREHCLSETRVYSGFRETFFPTLLPLLVSPCWSSPCLKQMLQRTCKHLVAQNLSSGALLPIPSRTRLHIAHTMPKAPFDLIFRFYFAPCVASRKRVTPATNGVVCEVTQTSAQHCFRVSLLYRYFQALRRLWNVIAWCHPLSSARQQWSACGMDHRHPRAISQMFDKARRHKGCVC